MSNATFSTKLQTVRDEMLQGNKHILMAMEVLDSMKGDITKLSEISALLGSVGAANGTAKPKRPRRTPEQIKADEAAKLASKGQPAKA